MTGHDGGAADSVPCPASAFLGARAGMRTSERAIQIISRMATSAAPENQVRLV
jgi:hypothetical protein